ncbi:MAG TPA: GTP-binding protein [Isosphaeraceae bacterium]|nr:GTP-binding protein [Isosphaeraceae bacterium]
MQRTRMILIGGFLGAGKTTTISQLARLHTNRGRRVGLITNDQASNLVDTKTLRRQGHEVREVSQACFCCAFPSLIDSAVQLAANQPLDVILGEPVGSCTDLAATVVQPLKQLFADRYAICPLLVLVDPHRARELLTGGPGSALPSDVLYIYQKQLEEADVIAINKIDMLATAEVDELTVLLASRFSQAQVVPISARTGAGLDRLVELLELGGELASGRHIAEVDYDVYAAGEAELGWLNGSLALSRSTPFELDALVLDLVDMLCERLPDAGGEVAHLKVLAEADGHEAVANLVRSGQSAELSRPSRRSATRAELIVNARVVIDPDELKAILVGVVSTLAAREGLDVAWGPSRSFRPGRPVPTHRFAQAV